MFFWKKKDKLKTANLSIPNHVAIIMDGNARWAKNKNLPLSFGHKTGAQNVKKIAENSIEIGIKYLTVYAFSSENWNRPKEEIDYLMNLLDEYLDNEIEPLNKKDIRIIISGNLEKLSSKTKDKILKVEELTKNNKSLTLNVAFSYGSRQEIVDAAKKIAIKVEKGETKIDDINEDLFKNNLYHPKIPDPDLIIRTAGDLRLSNFLLWQAAYSELYFTENYWPDFNKSHLLEAIESFSQRQRRYGAR